MRHWLHSNFHWQSSFWSECYLVNIHTRYIKDGWDEHLFAGFHSQVFVMKCTLQRILRNWNSHVRGETWLLTLTESPVNPKCFGFLWCNVALLTWPFPSSLINVVTLFADCSSILFRFFLWIFLQCQSYSGQSWLRPLIKQRGMITSHSFVYPRLCSQSTTIKSLTDDRAPSPEKPTNLEDSANPALSASSPSLSTTSPSRASPLQWVSTILRRSLPSVSYLVRKITRNPMK